MEKEIAYVIQYGLSIAQPAIFVRVDCKCSRYAHSARHIFERSNQGCGAGLKFQAPAPGIQHLLAAAPERFCPLKTTKPVLFVQLMCYAKYVC